MFEIMVRLIEDKKTPGRLIGKVVNGESKGKIVFPVETFEGKVGHIIPCVVEYETETFVRALTLKQQMKWEQEKEKRVAEQAERHDEVVELLEMVKNDGDFGPETQKKLLTRYHMEIEYEKLSPEDQKRIFENIMENLEAEEVSYGTDEDGRVPRWVTKTLQKTEDNLTYLRKKADNPKIGFCEAIGYTGD